MVQSNITNAKNSKKYFQIFRMLLAQGWDPNVKDDDTWTPLHYAAFYNKLDVCSELLLYSKIDVNITNKTGITALHFAALNAHEYVVELILTHSRAQTVGFVHRVAHKFSETVIESGNKFYAS